MFVDNGSATIDGAAVMGGEQGGNGTMTLNVGATTFGAALTIGEGGSGSVLA